MGIVSFSNIDAAWTVAIHFIPPSFPLSAEDPDTPPRTGPNFDVAGLGEDWEQAKPILSQTRRRSNDELRPSILFRFSAMQ